MVANAHQRHATDGPASQLYQETFDVGVRCVDLDVVLLGGGDS